MVSNGGWTSTKSLTISTSRSQQGGGWYPRTRFARSNKKRRKEWRKRPQESPRLLLLFLPLQLLLLVLSPHPMQKLSCLPLRLSLVALLVCHCLRGTNPVQESSWCCHIQCRGCYLVQRTCSVPPSRSSTAGLDTLVLVAASALGNVSSAGSASTSQVVAGYLSLIGMNVVVVWLSPGGWLLYYHSVNWDVIYCVAVLFSSMPVVDDCCVCSVQRYFLSSPSKSKILASLRHCFCDRYWFDYRHHTIPTLQSY